MIEDLLDMNSASVINTGQPTYQHYDGSRSHLDVSIVSNCLAAKSNCGVLNNTLGSNHCPLMKDVIHGTTWTTEIQIIKRALAQIQRHL